MSQYSLNVARSYGEKLKSFDNLEEAKQYFLHIKDGLLNEFERLCKDNPIFLPDYTAESLKKLEKCYFELFENDSFDSIGLDRKKFERIMSMYYGETAVRNNDTVKWVVREYAFVGGKYELMLNEGLCYMAISGMCNNWFERPSNKRRSLLFRKYNRFFNGNGSGTNSASQK